MPTEAGIQSGAGINKFKNLDSRSLPQTCRDRFRGNDSVFPIKTVSSGERERVRGIPSRKNRYGDFFAW
jgi:hypothetical protein